MLCIVMRKTSRYIFLRPLLTRTLSQTVWYRVSTAKKKAGGRETHPEAQDQAPHGLAATHDLQLVQGELPNTGDASNCCSIPAAKELQGHGVFLKLCVRDWVTGYLDQASFDAFH